MGYEDVLSFGSAFACLDRGAASTLKAKRAGIEHLDAADDLFRRLAADRLGFARRHEPFFANIAHCGDLNAHDVWLIFDGSRPVGYAVAGCASSILTVSDLLLEDNIDPQATVIALTRATSADYVQVMLNSPQEHEYFEQAGYRLARPAWGTFMTKPLSEGLTILEVCHLLGIGTGGFLTSWLDNT